VLTSLDVTQNSQLKSPVKKQTDKIASRKKKKQDFNLQSFNLIHSICLTRDEN
jgi:hypothetical protein